MRPDEYAARLRADTDAIGSLLRRGHDLTVPVPWCGAWTAYDVVAHLGGVHRWAAAATRTPPDGTVAAQTSPSGLSSTALADWFAEGAERLLVAVAVDPDRSCWTLAEPATVSFWGRRQAHETALHRWDLETALGRPLDARAVGPRDDFALDGVREVVEVLTPRQVRLGRLPAESRWVRLVVDGEPIALATGPERDPEPVAELSGPAHDVLLMLWGRTPARSPQVRGDAAALADFLRRPVTP